MAVVQGKKVQSATNNYKMYFHSDERLFYSMIKVQAITIGRQTITPLSTTLIVGFSSFIAIQTENGSTKNMII